MHNFWCIHCTHSENVDDDGDGDDNDGIISMRLATHAHKSPAEREAMKRQRETTE